MFHKINRGGKIVTIMSKHWQKSTNKKETEFRHWIDEVEAEVSELNKAEFKERGTSIDTLIGLIHKPL